MRRLAALAPLLALAALCGCGGGGGGSSTAPTPTTPATAQRTAQTQPPKQKKSHSPPQADPNPARQRAPEGAPLPGAKAVAAGVPVTKGGDNSIQSFGTEGTEAQRSQAMAELRAYLGALRSAQWARACALASAQLRAQLAKLIAQAKAKGGTQKPKGCAGTLAALLGGGSPASALAPLAHLGQLLSFRVRGPYAYLLYKGAKGRPMFVAMATEEGKWRVNVPKPEAFAAITGKGGGR